LCPCLVVGCLIIIYRYYIANIMSKLINIGSNVGYLIAAFVAHHVGKSAYGNLLFLLVIVSSLYHFNRVYYSLDCFVSLLVFSFSLWYLFQTPVREYAKVLALLFMFLMLIFLYINGRYGSAHYNILHPFAHVFGGLSTMIVALFGRAPNRMKYF
jgi:hypothetical protein